MNRKMRIGVRQSKRRMYIGGMKDCSGHNRRGIPLNIHMGLLDFYEWMYAIGPMRHLGLSVPTSQEELGAPEVEMRSLDKLCSMT